jgi:hypothetical protein
MIEVVPGYGNSHNIAEIPLDNSLNISLHSGQFYGKF